MLETKKEMIADYKNGLLKDVGYDCTEYYMKVIIVELNDDRVFGYIQWQQEERKFFLVKLNESLNGNKHYFFVNKRKYDLDNFLRV
jgi:hypothetical protein